jgi:GntR family transcriptional regulator/MocR family aminotransferase
MREDRLYAEAMSDWMMSGTNEPALLVGFTNIASQGDAEKLGRRILKLL